MDNFIESLLEKFREGLNLDGKKKVFENGLKLSSSYLSQEADPEAYTKEVLVEPVIRKFNLQKLSEIHFSDIKGNFRKVDYVLKNEEHLSFLVEVKPVNFDLFDKSQDGAVNQIKGLFKLVEVKENYEFGIATDGLKWVFIDKYSRIVYQYDIISQIKNIEELFIGKKEISSEKFEEEISKKFYEWYISLIHGGTYKDHENKKREISSSDCLVENINFVSETSEREEIAQTLMDRLIFIKFLQSKNIVEQDILQYLSKLDEDVLNEKLKQLFFQVFNTPVKNRVNIDQKFLNIPYLNGSLFIRTSTESKNPDYKIKSSILKEIITFLDSFKFVYIENVSNNTILDPEILGYIFEKAMTDKNRKNTGSYYTPKTVTNYLAYNTIHSKIIEKINKSLSKKGYKNDELVTNIDEIYKLRETTLNEIFIEIIKKLKICDNACGSGAFLLSAADILLEIYNRINGELRLGLSEIVIRKTILKNNIYGVDINPNAIEIAKLRLWLWLVTAYDTNQIEPLPNIDYNLRIGNTLFGFIDISPYKNNKITLNDWFDANNSLGVLLKKRDVDINKYKDSYGEEAKSLKEIIEENDSKIKNLLDVNYYKYITEKQNINVKEYQTTQPFHWGFEFNEVFEINDFNTTGFDIILGNPPYGNILTNIEKEMIEHYYTKNANEIAANFVERTLELIKKDGYIGLIVTNSIAINESTSEVRSIIRKNMSKSKMALFGTRPAKIFQDAEIRVLIFIGKKDEPKKEGIIYTTDAIKFTKEQKSTLLDNLQFESTNGLTLGKNKIGDKLADTSLPKVGNITIRNILIKLKKSSKIVVEDIINKKEYEVIMEFRKTGGYWLNALEKIPYNSTKIQEVKFKNTLERDFVILLINSSLFYLYWSTYGNLRDFPPSLLDKFPFPDNKILIKNKSIIIKLKNKISNCLLKCFIPDTGRNGEFRTGSCKKIIDEIDEVLGIIYKLDINEINYIKGYDNHIRKKT